MFLPRDEESITHCFSIKTPIFISKSLFSKLCLLHVLLAIITVTMQKTYHHAHTQVFDLRFANRGRKRGGEENKRESKRWPPPKRLTQSDGIKLTNMAYETDAVSDMAPKCGLEM